MLFRTFAVYITLKLMQNIVDRETVDYLNWLGESISGCNLPANTRVRAAGGCLAIAQDNHRAIVVLLDHEIYASAFALVRVALEAYVRGEWLAMCATDSEVEEFVNGEEPPPFGLLLQRLELTEAFEDQVLSRVKKKSWSAMCAFTHTGGLHVQRWNTPEGIEPDYSEEEVRKVLSSAETIGALAVIGVAWLAEDVSTAEKVLERFKRRYAN